MPGGHTLRSAKFLFAVFAFLLATTALTAQPVPQVSSETAGYPVTLEGREILRIYEGIGSFTAQDRAQAASERFDKLIYAPAADLANLTAGDSAYGTAITLGDSVLLVVTDDDAKHYHISRQALATFLAGRIRNAIEQARLQHSSQFLIRAEIGRASCRERVCYVV